MFEYKNETNPTEEEMKEDGAFRMAKYRHQAEQFRKLSKEKNQDKPDEKVPIKPLSSQEGSVQNSVSLIYD